MLLASTLFGWSLHIYDLPPSVLPPSRQVSLAAQSLFILATSFAKLSILLSYLRFAPACSAFRRATYVVAGLLVAANIGFLVLLFTQCVPLASYWTLGEGGHCVPEGPPLLAQAASTVFFDAAVWVLPLGTLARARLPVRERVAVVGLFGAGAVVVAAAAVRTYWVWWVVEGTWDVTWEGFELWIWTAVEVHLGVICGCVPCLKGLVGGCGVRRKGGGRKGGGVVYLGREMKRFGEVEVHVGGEGGDGSTVGVLGRGGVGGGRGSGDGQGKMERWSSSVGSDHVSREGRRQDG